MVTFTFEATGDDQKRIYARFTSAKRGTIQAQLIEGGNPCGNVDFKDPWLNDSTDEYGTPTNRVLNAIYKNRTSPFNIDSTTSYNGDVYRGVFLNQYPPTDTSHPPYYTFRAPQTQSNINGFTGYFQNWSATNATFKNANAQQTGVVFTGANATVSANYKGHLVSSTNQATISGNGRGRTIAADRYAIYTSTGKLWYTTSSDNGASWGNERLIGENVINPSISKGLYYLGIVWETIEGDRRKIIY